MTEPYAVRKINLTFGLSSGSFAIKGHRVLVNVENANLPTTGIAQIRVYGLTLDHMNQLSVAGLVYKANLNAKNTVKVDAGDDVSGMTTVFSGTIFEAYPDMRMPDVSFVILANPAHIAQLKPVEPSSFPGAAPIETVLGSIVKKAGLALENNGVKTVLASPYFAGTAWNQILGAVRAADCFGVLDNIKNTLAIWTKAGSRAGSQVLIAPETGMIGYPQFQALHIVVRMLFNTEVTITPGVGYVIRVKSQLTAANGEFTVTGVSHTLMSEMPDGPWETTVNATPKGKGA